MIARASSLSASETWSSPSLAAVLRVAALAAFFRLLGAAIAWKIGFRAVSDDDFARVVIAQKFAVHPRLDPTGSSWLPLPFWVVGSAMAIAGRTLAVARAVAVASTALSSGLLAAIALRIGLSERRVIAASALVGLMPWGVMLAVATVPEAPAAALAAAGMLTLASPSPRLRLVGAFCLLASCWSRYDAWPIAFAFSALSALDAFRSKRDRGWWVASVLVGVAGPIAWSAWQAVVYHDALRYLRLVRSYREALGGPPKLVTRMFGYPLSAIEEFREVTAAGLIALVAWLILRSRQRSASGARDAESSVKSSTKLNVRWGRPLALAALQLATLIVGDLRDGAPTHHPERALLGSAIVVVLASSDAIGGLLAATSRVAVRYALGALAAGWLLWWIPLRLHRTLPWYANAPRVREVAAGQALARASSGPSPVLIDTRDLGGIDYGYFAVLAAFGRPEVATIDRDQDPRHPRTVSSFADPASLAARVGESNARVLLCWGADRRAVAEAIGGRTVEVEEHDGAEPAWSIVALP